MKVTVSVDVPSIEEGLAFFGEVLGSRKPPVLTLAMQS